MGFRPFGQPFGQGGFGQPLGQAGGNPPELNVVAPAITPTIGAELLADPGLEAWTSPTNLTSYAETANGSSTNNQETVVIHGGANACRMDVDSSNSLCQIAQGILTANNWYQHQAWARSGSGTPTVRIGQNMTYDFNINTTYTQYTGTGLASSVNAGWLRITATSLSLYWDDLSSKLLTFSSLYSALLGTHYARDGSYICTPTVTVGTQAGMMLTYTDDNNFTLAIVNRGPTNPAATLYKRVAGVYTSVISGNITYVAGAPLKVTISGNSFSLFYNGVQVGTTQTIADSLPNAGVYGFSTLAANSVGTVTTATP